MLTRTLRVDYYDAFVDAMTAGNEGRLSPDEERSGAAPYSAQRALGLLHDRMRLYGWNVKPVTDRSLIEVPVGSRTDSDGDGVDDDSPYRF